MRVLQVNKYHFLKGGAERYYLDLCRLLAEQGHRVSHFAMLHDQNESSAFSDFFAPGVDYRSGMGPVRRLKAALDVIYNVEAKRRMRDLLSREHPDIAHLHNIYHQLSPSVIDALAGQGVPVVQTLHDYKIICPGYLLMTQGQLCERCRGGRYWNAVQYRCLLDSTGASLVGFLEATFHRLRGTYGKVKLFIAPSRFMREKVIEFGIERDRVVHLPYFLPLEEYEPRYGSSNYFVYSGRLSREKGLMTLLQALRLGAADGMECLILGDGPLRESLEKQAAEWDLHNVRFLGHQPRDRLKDLVAGAAFTVVPSEWYENLPFAVIESLALGTPVVGARIGGIPEMVLEGRTGVTFAPGSPQALVDAIDRLRTTAGYPESLGREARRFAEAMFDPSGHLQKLMGIYEEAIE